MVILKEERWVIFSGCYTLWCLQWDIIALSYQGYCNVILKIRISGFTPGWSWYRIKVKSTLHRGCLGKIHWPTRSINFTAGVGGLAVWLSSPYVTEYLGIAGARAVANKCVCQRWTGCIHCVHCVCWDFRVIKFLHLSDMRSRYARVHLIQIKCSELRGNLEKNLEV